MSAPYARALRLHRHRLRAGRVRRRDPRRPARHEDRRGREGHRSAAAASTTPASRPRPCCASPTSWPRSTTPDEFGIKVDGRTVDFGKVSERREKVIKTLTGGVAGLFKKNKIDVIEGVGSLAGDGKVKVGDETYDGGEGDRARHRLGAQADPGHAVRRPRDRHRGGVGAGRAAADARRASARAPRARRSPRRTGGWAPRCCCSRRSTACCRPRTPTSPRSPTAGSPSRTSKIHTGTLVENVESQRRQGHVHLRRRRPARPTSW